MIEIAGFDTTNHVSPLQNRWLQDNNITELPPELFQDLENLQELDLSNNELGNLPPHIFRNITAIEFLKLDYNKIERLHEDQFQGLVKLFELDIFGNKIRNVSSTTFTYAHELRFLFMHYNLMAELPRGLFTQQLKHIIRVKQLGAHGTIREIRARAQSAQAKRERALAKRVFFIILTDFLCWIPIIAIGIKSHVEKTFDPPGDLAVWIAVFALPINSAVNPLLYTLSTPQVQAILKPKLRKLWFNVRSFLNRGQNLEEEAENDQQGHFGNEGAHANNEEGEHIEMQEIEYHEIPVEEAPELPDPQLAMEQVCRGDESASSSDYDDDFDIQPATKKTVKVQEGKIKPQPGKPTGEAGESKEQVGSEEIAGPSDKASECEEQVEKEEIPGPSDKAGEPEEQMESEEISVSSDQGQEGESKPEHKRPTEEAGESEEQETSEEIPVRSDKEEENALEPKMDVAEEDA
ncbi:Relaxin receptor 1 [Stylophora pistillata]|uniref:Relaxin receptor 1 n=2 Tax=Stylophora pistillata TaxID=50429 RepID=A0A2B4R921_STYPI|nr:Relaxin receptor 1 [Stylophora pistillata]